MLPLTEIIDLAKQICRGLRYAHSCNIIHRDIKPQNVLLEKNGVARLSDFGIAKIFSGTNITMTGSAVGTPEYMSPEQAQGKPLDAQTDIYSLGVVMYEMVTRHPPFTGNNPMAIAYKQVHELPVPPSMKRKDTPKRLELIILKALKKEKRDRYSSVEEMLDHLDSVDLDEKVEISTARTSSAVSSSARKKTDDFDRRITDRRSSERRSTGKTPSYRMFSFRYWVEMVKMQWLTWLMVGAVGAILLDHILNHP
jgi:serine/threonine-protein kinase